MATPQEISRAEACAHLKNFHLVDPLGIDTVDAIVQAGQPFALNLPSGRLVYVLRWLGNRLLISAAAGKTKGETSMGLRAIERQARFNQATAVCFQTPRPGLVKLALKNGYQIKGWILEKEVSHGSDA